MRTIISQSVVLPAPAESLFAMYTDPAKHAAITGAPVAISVEPGSPFQAFNGALTGATLQIIPQRLVIQSWRSTRFNDADSDSALILAFTLASGSWWKLPMAAISCGDVIGSCDQIKDLLGGGDIQGPPAVDFAQRDLPTGQQRPK